MVNGSVVQNFNKCYALKIITVLTQTTKLFLRACRFQNPRSDYLFFKAFFYYESSRGVQSDIPTADQ